MNKSNKGFSAVAVLLILLSVGVITFVGWYVYRQRDKTTSATNVSTEPTNTFYYTEMADKVISYNPVTKAKSTTVLPLTEDRIIATTSAGVNMSVQVRDKGQKIFYVSVKPKPGALSGGAGEPERDSMILSVLENQQETRLLELSTASGQSIRDWAVTADGSKVYYMAQGPGKDAIDLRLLNVSDKKDTSIKADLAMPGTINNPLFLDSKGALLVYSGAENNAFTEHKVTGTAYAKRDLGTPCKCMLEYPQAVSPDGTKLLLEEQTSGTEPSNFIYHVLDTKTNKVTVLAKPSINGQWVASVWSPTSDRIAYSTLPFGDKPPEYVQSLEIIGIGNKKSKQVKTTEPLQNNDNVSVVGWSPDGRYLAYKQNDDLKFYDVKMSETLDETLPGDSFSTSDISFGWY